MVVFDFRATRARLAESDENPVKVEPLKDDLVDTFAKVRVEVRVVVRVHDCDLLESLMFKRYRLERRGDPRDIKSLKLECHSFESSRSRQVD